MTGDPVQWRWSRVQRIVLRAGAVAALLIAVLAKLQAPPGARSMRASTVVGITIFCVWAWRSAACHVAADTEGIHEVRRFGGRRLPWSDLESVRMGTFGLRLTGGGHSIALAADADGERIVDAVLRQAPSMWLLGHGLGLRTDPPPEGMLLPDAVHVDEHALRIDGPAENRLVFSTRRADYPQLLQHARNRLVAAMLRADRGAPIGPAAAD